MKQKQQDVLALCHMLRSGSLQDGCAAGYTDEDCRAAADLIEQLMCERRSGSQACPHCSGTGVLTKTESDDFGKLLSISRILGFWSRQPINITSLQSALQDISDVVKR